MIDQNGQRSMVTNQGADFHLQVNDLPIDILQACAHVHITAWSLFTDPPRAAALQSAQIAKAAGATVSFDPASFQMIEQMGVDAFRTMAASMPIDIIFPNRDEGAALTGEREPVRIAQKLREYLPGAIVVLKLDKDGCFVLKGDQGQMYPAKSEQVIDATGAGDAFDGAFLARYLRDGSLEAAATFANAVGGWVVAHYGARPAADPELEAILTQ
jgi:sugar/nucleoside kinase (ribokinase family)